MSVDSGSRLDFRSFIRPSSAWKSAAIGDVRAFVEKITNLQVFLKIAFL